jgi:4-alpha-glucanotransferase
MKITFYLKFRADEGTKLHVEALMPDSEGRKQASALEMHSDDRLHWTLRLELPHSVKSLDYSYFTKTADGQTVFESRARRRHVEFQPPGDLHLFDCWQETPSDVALYTAAFTQTFFAHEPVKQPPADFERTLILRVSCPRVAKHGHVALTGNQASLGFWEPQRARAMYPDGSAGWEIRLNADEIIYPLEYKFIVCDESGQEMRWESGENRLLEQLPQEKNITVRVATFPFRESLPLWKGAGTVIPVFSLRSEQSFGIGDFHDLKLLVDWAIETHQRLIQILPVNDTTHTHSRADSYPYSAISIYALHPVYISLTDMGLLRNTEHASFFRQMQQTLNAGETVDYEAAEKNKLRYCRLFFKQQGAELLKSKAFQTFWKTEHRWLIPYAAFCCYRDHYATSDFSEWGDHAVYHAGRERGICAPDSEFHSEFAFICFLQFMLHTQFRDVSAYARQKGMILKGDLPIGIHRTSVEAWTETAYFNPDGQAGAPPDAFSETGQNWSFPTYNWDVMEKDDFQWWKKRFRNLEAYFTAFRIDHILGFFRIWEIPQQYVDGLCGYFRPALPFRPEELLQFGVAFQESYARPRIHSRFLHHLFGDAVHEATEKYLMPDGDNHWTLRPFCDTQRKIGRLFCEPSDPPSELSGHRSELLRNALFVLSREVLFLPDPAEPKKYHPRISGSQTYVYRELSEVEQQAFDRLSHHFFYERHRIFWKETALRRLTPLTSSTDMLICGEDLGMIPDSVPEVMDRLHILSLELERAPKISGLEFAGLHRLPYMSVCTTSTHDMHPLRSWWTENYERTQRYYSSVLHGDGAAPEECPDGLCTQIISNHLASSSMLTVIPMQDWLSMSDVLRRTDASKERINEPANPHHYWCYRMHTTLETLLSSDDFNSKVRQMIAESGRNA